MLFRRVKGFINNFVLHFPGALMIDWLIDLRKPILKLTARDNSEQSDWVALMPQARRRIWSSPPHLPHPLLPKVSHSLFLDGHSAPPLKRTK